MPTTFQTAYTDVLDYINRPSGEMLNQAKRELNNTLLWMQRRIKFAMSERLVRIAVPAGSLMVNISEACDGRPRNYIGVQRLADSAGTSGVPLRVRRYSEIMAEKSKFERRRIPNYPDGSPIDDGLGNNFNEALRQQSAQGMVAFLISDNIGLYPTQSTEQNLLVHLHVFLAPLVDTTDTNFLLDNCYDFVLLKTLQRMSVYLKDDVRLQVDAEEMKDAWESIVQWNSEVMMHEPETI